MFIFLFGNLNVSAQAERKTVLSIAPLNLINPLWPNLQLGSEFFLKDNLGLEINVGTFVPIFSEVSPAPTTKEMYGIILRPELKRYIRNRAKKDEDGSQSYFSSYYNAVEVFFWGNTYNRGYSFMRNEDINDTYFAYQKIGSYKIGSHLKFGYHIIGRSGLSFDIYMGVGAAYYSAKYIDKIEDLFAPIYKKPWFSRPIGQCFYYNISFGFKLGYAIKKAQNEK